MCISNPAPEACRYMPLVYRGYAPVFSLWPHGVVRQWLYPRNPQFTGTVYIFLPFDSNLIRHGRIEHWG